MSIKKAQKRLKSAEIGKNCDLRNLTIFDYY